MANTLYYTTGSASTTATISTRPRKRRRLFIEAGSEPRFTDKTDTEMVSVSHSGARFASNVRSRLTRATPPPPAVPNNTTVSSVQQTPAAGKASSARDFRCGTPRKANSTKAVIEWDDEFRANHACRTDLTIDEFFDSYVPCTDDLPDAPPFDATDIFSVLRKSLPEGAMYTPLVSGLNKLVEGFPPELRPHFVDTHSTQFDPLHWAQHETYPDICNGFPGAATNLIEDWTQAANVWEAKRNISADPILSDGQCQPSRDHQETRVQLAKNGVNLLQQHKSCFVFVIGVYGPTFRIFRFDRSGVISSISVNYVLSPHTLQKFLWRLVHPRRVIPRTVVGWDPTIRRVTTTEFERMFGLLLDLAPDLKGQKGTVKQGAFWMRACARLKEHSLVSTVPGYTGNLVVIPPEHRLARTPFKRNPNQGEVVECFVFETLHSSNGLFSRASGVYKVLIDHDNFRGRIFVLKDSWQQRTRIDEGYYYERIEEHFRQPQIQQTIKHELGDFMGDSNVSGLTDYVGTFNLALHEDADKYGLVTQSARLRPKASKTCDPSDFDRDRIRTLTGCVGSHITSFDGTKQLVTALRDVVIGLAIAYLCGVLHRDVSLGNVLLHQQKSGGFLHDFDYSTIAISELDPHPEQFKDYIDKELKDMTGTWPFMALGILGDEKEDHHLRHDLESVYWVLIWCVLCHVKHGHSRGTGAAAWLFESDDRYAKKYTWVGTQELKVPGNPALTELFERLRVLVKANAKALKKCDRSKELTPRKMLEVINKALARSDWPPDDSSVSYDPPPSDTMQARNKVKQENLLHNQHSLQGGGSPQFSSRRSRSTPSEAGPQVEGIPEPPPSLNRTSAKRKRSNADSIPNKATRSSNTTPLNTHEGTESEA